MKTAFYKATLLAVLGLGSITAAQAQATYHTGDLLVGFTTGTGNDLIYDLGQESSLVNGQSFTGLSTLLTSTYGSSLSGVSWGVLGNLANSGSPRTAFTTTTVGFVPNTITGNSAFGQLNTVAQALSQDFAGPGAIAAGQSATPAASSTISWYTETLNGTLTTDYINAYENPNVTGVGSADFSQVLSDGSNPTLLGDFNLGADDSFTFTTAGFRNPPLTACWLSAGS